MSTHQRIAPLILSICWLLTSCGGGGGQSSEDMGGGSSNFNLQYTNTKNVNGQSLIDDANFFFDWFVENSDRSVRGPFESNASGVVKLGADNRTRANVTLKLLPGFYYTYVGMPVGQQRYFTGNRMDSVPQSITVRNQGGSGQVKMGTDQRGWFNVDRDPFSLPSHGNYYPYLMMSRDNLVSVFASYRASDAEEPNTRYKFSLDLPLSTVTNLDLDLAALHSRVTRNWQSPDKNLGSTPCVIADRRGQLFMDIGGGVGGGTTGTFSIPEQLPADRWFLADNCYNPSIVARFSITDDQVQLRASDRYVVDGSFSMDYAQRRVSFILGTVSGKEGTDPFEFGELVLKFGTTGNWMIYFPWSMASALTVGAETVVTVPLPALPNYESLPTFNFVHLKLYRIDDGGTADDMLQYTLNPKENNYRAHAAIGRFQSL